MFGLSKLWSAVATLATELTSLASTVRETNAGIRAQLHLDHQADSEPPLLPVVNTEGPAQARNGKKTRAATTTTD